MSKMNELHLAVTELKRCGEALIGISDSLADLFNGNRESRDKEQPIDETPEPKEEPVTLEMVRAVLAERSRAGYTTKVRELLEKHGAVKLSEIDSSEYPALLAEATVLGNG